MTGYCSRQREREREREREHRRTLWCRYCASIVIPMPSPLPAVSSPQHHRTNRRTRATLDQNQITRVSPMFVFQLSPTKIKT